MHPKYPHLFSPIKIGPLTLKNRIVAAPGSQNDIEPDGTLTKYNCAYYARKAQGGVSLVALGDGIIHPNGKDHPNQVLLYRDECIHSLMRCAEDIHKYNSIATIELSHGGIVCDPAFIGGQRPFGPSEVPVSIGFQTDAPVEILSQALTEEMMRELAGAYAAAAARVKRAGFDMVTVHGAHGWLISQFLSPKTNLRTDAYGGSIENRCRFPIMVLESIRAEVGPRFPIELRINGEDGVEGGLTNQEAVQICKLLEPYVDVFSVSASVHYAKMTQDLMQSTIFDPRGHLLPLAAAIKKAVGVPVAAVGGFTDPDMMERALAEGQADLLAVGRQLLADMDFANKIKDGREDEIRHCLRCATCQSHRFKNGATRCSVNPTLGREYELQFMPPAREKRKILVVGGGPGGMQAAITAAERGHEVVLYEKEDHFGGALNFAEKVPFKYDLYRLIHSMQAQLRALPVRVVLGTELTPELAQLEHPDLIIAAVGADAIRPPFPGIDRQIVLMAEEVDRGAPVGEEIIVIGGGLVGIETALHLAHQGKKVSIVEMTDKVGADANIRYERTYHAQLRKWDVALYTDTKCRAIEDNGIRALNADGEEIFLDADTVVIAVGMRPREAAVERLRDCAPEFFPIGNCVAAGQVKNAIRGGFDAAMFAR